MEHKTKAGFSLYVNSKENIQKAIELKEKKKKYRIGLAAALIIVAIAMIFAYRYRTFHRVNVVADVTKDLSDSAKAFDYGDGSIYYNEDGISYLGSDGSIQWNKTYSFQNPIADYCGDYVAVAAKNGNEVIVIEEDGSSKNFTVSYPIMDVEVSEQGVVALILRGDDGNIIEMYQNNGGRLVSIKANIKANGYPMDIDLSENGENLIVSYLLVDGLEAKSKVSFYNFGDVGQEKEDQMVGSFEFDDTVIPRVSYLGGSNACAVGDNQIVFFDAGDEPKKSKTVKVSNTIKSIGFHDDRVAVVTEYASSRAEDKYCAYVYSGSGREVMSKDFSTEYTHMQVGQGELLLYGSYHCSIMNFAGHEMFSQNFEDRIINIAPTGVSRRYVVTYDDKTQIISLR